MIFDLHNDYPTRLDSSDYPEYLQKCGVEAMITAVIWTSAFGKDALAVVTNISSRLEKPSETIPIAIEDIGFTAERDIYRTFDFSKYLYCSLTWNSNNGFAGGALDDGTLTHDGELVIERINESGCVVDLAHLNKKSFYAVLDRAKLSVCSHTGFNSHPRSLDDGMIRALVDRRSLIGLCAVTAFTGAKSAKCFADVIDGFVQKYGSECLALGTDFMGSDDIPKDISTYSQVITTVQTLKSRGYADEVINDILYRNASSFYDRRFKR